MSETTARHSPLGKPRVRLEQPIKLQYDYFDSFVTEVSANISVAGMFITTLQPRPPGSQFDFEFTLGQDFTLIEGRGEVVWVRPQGEAPERPPGMGIKFLHLEPSSRRVIEQVVEQRIESGEEPFTLATEEPDHEPIEPETTEPEASAPETIEPETTEPEATEPEPTARQEPALRETEEDEPLEVSSPGLAELRDEVAALRESVHASSRKGQARLEELDERLATARADVAELERRLLRAGAGAEEKLLAVPSTKPSGPAAGGSGGGSALRAAAAAFGGAVIGALLVFAALRVAPPRFALPPAGAPGQAARGPAAPPEAGPEGGAAESPLEESRARAESPPAEAAAKVSTPGEAPAGAEPQLAAAPPAHGVAPPDPLPASDDAPKPDYPAISEMLTGWAAAWSEQRVEDYLEFYSRSFRPEAGQERGAWARERRQRLLRPAWIRVTLENLELLSAGTERAGVRFDQIYESDRFGDRTTKRLELVWEDTRWKIAAETSE